MKIFQFSPQLRLCITSPEPVAALQHLNRLGLTLHHCAIRENFELIVTVSRQDFDLIQQETARRGETLRILGRSGLFWTCRRLLHRPVLMLGLLFWLVFAMLLPTRVLFLQVEGNSRIPARLILEKAEQQGIRFGCSRRSIRSEALKNALLEQIPGLQWAGINTAGCTAVLSVREGPTEPGDRTEPIFSDIIARRDALVLSAVARRGSLMTAPGQVVRKGQILISGCSDHDRLLRLQRADGEVFGQTRREISVKMTSHTLSRTAKIRTKQQFALCIGKKRINFYKDSGNSPVSCDKISVNYRMTLPGGWILPVTLVRETLTVYETSPQQIPPQQARQLLMQSVSRSLRRQMIAGTVLQQHLELVQGRDSYLLEGHCACTEMIGREQTEEQ